MSATVYVLPAFNLNYKGMTMDNSAIKTTVPGFTRNGVLERADLKSEFRFDVGVSGDIRGVSTVTPLGTVTSGNKFRNGLTLAEFLVDVNVDTITLAIEGDHSSTPNGIFVSAQVPHLNQLFATDATAAYNGGDDVTRWTWDLTANLEYGAPGWHTEHADTEAALVIVR